MSGEDPKPRPETVLSKNKIDWLNLNFPDGSSLTIAGCFGIRVGTNWYHYFKEFDYLDLSPFDEPRLPDHDVNLNLTEIAQCEPDDEIKIYNIGNIVRSSLNKITNNQGDAYSAALQVMRDRGTKELSPLVIFGHGADVSGIWTIGHDNLPTESLLQNLEEILNVMSPKIGVLSDRYSCIILDSCNITGRPIPQSVVDRIGIPVLYSNNVVGGVPNPSSPTFIKPTVIM